MSWDPLARRFREIGVPVRFADRGWFSVDVDRSGRRERIRLSPGDAQLHVMDSDRDRRQLLLQARRGPDWAGRRQAPLKLLVGQDERQLFSVTVPSWRRVVNTVAAAHEALKPDAVRAAGRKAVRQGEWFFVPFPWIGERYGIRRRVRLGWRNPHVIDQVLGNPSDLFGGRPRNSWSSGAVYARGFVRHREHRPLHLRCWHRIYLNTAGVVSGGSVD